MSSAPAKQAATGLLGARALLVATCALSLMLFLPDAAGARAQAETCPATPTLDAMVHALDAAVSGPGTKDWTCMKQLFLPDARLVPLVVAQDGTATPNPVTVDQYIDRAKGRGAQSIQETQLSYKYELYGHVAQVFSTYEITLSGKLVSRGINSIQAIFDGKQWKVIEIVWDKETPENPIPKKYLP